MMPDPGIPSPPSLHVVDSSTLRVSWPAVLGADFYAVEMTDGLNKRFVDWPTNLLQADAGRAKSGAQTSVIVTCLQVGVPYTARVAAQQDGAWSEYSAPSAVAILAKPSVPQAPSLLTAHSRALRVSWSAVPGADYYAVEVSNGVTKGYVDWPTNSLQVDGSRAKSGAQTSVIVKGLQVGVRYEARVAAQQGGVWSDYSPPSLVQVVSTFEEAPTLERVNDSMMVVSWAAVPGASQYDVVVYDGERKYVNWQTNLLQTCADSATRGTTTSVLVKGLRADTGYKAKISVYQGQEWFCGSAYSAVLKPGASQSRKRPAEQDCVVCLNKAAQVAMDPCGHLCACEQCATTVTNCPLCRGSVRKRLRVYT